jgi:hypothetical protein
MPTAQTIQHQPDRPDKKSSNICAQKYVLLGDRLAQLIMQFDVLRS